MNVGGKDNTSESWLCNAEIVTRLQRRLTLAARSFGSLPMPGPTRQACAQIYWGAGLTQ
jgi:hypothetical protein